MLLKVRMTCESDEFSFCAVKREVRATSLSLARDRVLNLDAVGLVDDDVLPMVLLERALLLDHHLVRRDADIKIPRHETVVAKLKAGFFVTVEFEDVKSCRPRC